MQQKKESEAKLLEGITELDARRRETRLMLNNALSSMVSVLFIPTFVLHCVVPSI